MQLLYRPVLLLYFTIKRESNQDGKNSRNYSWLIKLRHLFKKQGALYTLALLGNIRPALSTACPTGLRCCAAVWLCELPRAAGGSALLIWEMLLSSRGGHQRSPEVHTGESPACEGFHTPGSSRESDLAVTAHLVHHSSSDEPSLPPPISEKCVI